MKEQNHNERAEQTAFPLWSLFLKGFFMGIADVIPGVSGGTIALIVGIYRELIETISNYDAKMLLLLRNKQWKELHTGMNLRFLVPLGLGIVTAVFGLARLMSYLLHHHEALTFSVFFGLILGSIYFMIRDLKRSVPVLVCLVLGAVFTYFLVGMLPVETPPTLLAYFLSAVIAICAMILPGISGSFLLLLMGKYKQVMEVVKQPFAEGHLLIIAVFLLGAVLGIIGFSKVLKWMLKHYYNVLFAFLIGMMLGSLRKLWPFYDGAVFFELATVYKLGLMLTGMMIVIVVQQFESKKSQDAMKDTRR